MTQGFTNQLFHGGAPGYGFSHGEFTEDLFLNVGENTFETWAVAQGEVLVPGSIVAMNETTYELVQCSNALTATTGAVPYGIVLHPIDTSATGLNAVSSMAVIVRSMGTFNISALKYEDTGYSEDEIRVAMRKVGLSANGTYHSAI